MDNILLPPFFFIMNHDITTSIMPFFYSFYVTYLGDATLVGRVGDEWAAEERDLATAGACVLEAVPGGAPPPEPA